MISNTDSALPSCKSKARTSAPRSRSNGFSDSSAALRAAFISPSDCGFPLKSTTFSGIPALGSSSCFGSPPSMRNADRRISCREATSDSAFSNASMSSEPVRRMPVVIFWAQFGCSRSSTQSRCCANERGVARVGSTWSSTISVPWSMLAIANALVAVPPGNG